MPLNESATIIECVVSTETINLNTKNDEEKENTHTHTKYGNKSANEGDGIHSA